MAEAELKPCSNPVCDQPGTSSCGACKTTFYCGVACQTADWPRHKEECEGHLRKVGNANFLRADGFNRDRNWVQTLRYADLAATKLKKLKDRRLETVKLIDAALTCKFNALTFMGRYKEAMECAEENYTLWAMNHMRHPGSIKTALGLIQSCIENKEYEDAEHYARHAMFMINDMTDNFIPSEERPKYLADGSFWLARAIYNLARVGGIPPEGKQKAGEEAIVLAHQALEIHTRLYGTESAQVAADMMVLANLLDHFNDDDDDEILSLYEQANVITSRAEGCSTLNVATTEDKLARAYINRANRAQVINDVDRCMANLELALPHYREADRIYRTINRVEQVDRVLRNIAGIEVNIRLIKTARAAVAAAPTVAAVL